MNICASRLYEVGIDGKSDFEFYLEIEGKPELFNRKLSGYIDCITKQGEVYEFKIGNTITQEHILQMAFYMYMYETYKLDNGITEMNTYFIYNISENSLFEIRCSYEGLQNMVYYFIHTKYVASHYIRDEKFLENCRISLDGV